MLNETSQPKYNNFCSHMQAKIIVYMHSYAYALSYAAEVLNERCLSVARYSWKREQEEIFKRFYERSNKGILRASDIAVEGTAMSMLQTDQVVLA